MLIYEVSSQFGQIKKSEFGIKISRFKGKGLVYRSIGGTAVPIFETIDLRGLRMRLPRTTF